MSVLAPARLRQDVPRRVRPRGRPRRMRWIVAALLLAPAAAFFAAFALVPMIMAGVLSLYDWDGVSPAEYAGLGNWTEAFTDPVTARALLLTVQVMGLSWLIQTPISLLLGVYLAGRQRHRAVLGVLYFLPLLFSAVAVGLIWSSAILAPSGALNTALSSVGLSGLGRTWLGDTSLAVYAVIAVIAWQFIPFHTLLYQAGARQVPQVLYEAARIDGAGTLQQFFRITLPQLKYTIITSTVLILTGSLTYFDVVFVMTGGGPGYATRILPLHMYLSAFKETDFGYGSAIAVILATVGLTLSIVLLRVTGFSRMRSQQEGF
ncbi:MAG: ABC transporter permease subunit [Streptosporangiales bacterium]|nr:ABC transporter permease subunit [Streptosporangiales bacterium]